MSSQSLKGLAILVTGVLLVCFADFGFFSYGILGWGGFLFMRGLSEGSAE
jgi:hypothetical protein